MSNHSMTDEAFDQQYRTGKQRGEERLQNAVRAMSASYDPVSRRVMVELANQCVFIFPVALAQGLHDAPDEALADIRLLSHGLTLDWPRLDVQFALEGLLAGQFGTNQWMNDLASRPQGKHPKQARRVAG